MWFVFIAKVTIKGRFRLFGVGPFLVLPLKNFYRTAIYPDSLVECTVAFFNAKNLHISKIIRMFALQFKIGEVYSRLVCGRISTTL